jgi:general secretion pathway protein G
MPLNAVNEIKSAPGNDRRRAPESVRLGDSADLVALTGRCGMRDRARQRALTLVELLLAITILGVVSTLAYAGYQQYLDKAKIAQAKVDIRTMEASLERYRIANARFPETLAEAGLANKLDPWQHPYQYLNITTAKNRGQVRKDRNLVPINSDYDLYSMGKDGLSKPPLTAKPSRDDVIRANDGGFVGLASDF